MIMNHFGLKKSGAQGCFLEESLTLGRLVMVTNWSRTQANGAIRASRF
jgi:hypothetical protein